MLGAQRAACLARAAAVEDQQVREHRPVLAGEKRHQVELDFLGVLDNWSTLLDFEVEYYAQVAAHEKALASLEELTGLDLVLSGGSE